MTKSTGGGGPQLTLFVEQDRRTHGTGIPPVTSATIKLGKNLVVRRDFNPGEELTVTITDSAGKDVAAGLFTVEGIGFVPVKAALRLTGSLIASINVQDADDLDLGGAPSDRVLLAVCIERYRDELRTACQEDQGIPEGRPGTVGHDLGKRLTELLAEVQGR